MSTCRIRRTVTPSAAGGSESTTVLLPQLGCVDLAPLHARGGQDDALRQPISARHQHLFPGDVEHLDTYFVLGTGIVGIDDAHPVGHHQSTFEWCAASSENTQEESRRHLD